jgi:hypothetical protein
LSEAPTSQPGGSKQQHEKKAALTKEIAPAVLCFALTLTLTFASRLLPTSTEGDHLHPEVIKGLVTP